MKRIVILVLCFYSVFSGCAEAATISGNESTATTDTDGLTKPVTYDPADLINREELTALFQNNEASFAAVADELYPLGVEVFLRKENSVVISETMERKRNDDIPASIKQAASECLELMEVFIAENHSNGEYMLEISTMIIGGFSDPFVLYYSIDDRKAHFDSGILYTTDKVDGYGFQEIKPYWYLYSYAGM